MSSIQQPHLHLEVGHILFLDVVGCSKLLAEKQKELVRRFEAHRPVIFHLVNKITFSVGVNVPQRKNFSTSMTRLE
jgi:hypothetical protein